MAIHWARISPWPVLKNSDGGKELIICGGVSHLEDVVEQNLVNLVKGQFRRYRRPYKIMKISNVKDYSL